MWQSGAGQGGARPCHTRGGCQGKSAWRLRCWYASTDHPGGAAPPAPTAPAAPQDAERCRELAELAAMQAEEAAGRAAAAAAAKRAARARREDAKRRRREQERLARERAAAAEKAEAVRTPRGGAACCWWCQADANARTYLSLLTAHVCAPVMPVDYATGNGLGRDTWWRFVLGSSAPATC